MITLYFLKSLELYFVFIYQKKIYWKKIGFEKISKNLFLPLAGRPLAELNCSVGRLGGRPTCTKVHKCTSSTESKSSALCLFWSTGTVDRQRVLTLCLGSTVDRPVDRFPNGRKSDRWRSTARSTDRREIC